MYKNHCKKQHSVHLPSFCSTVNGTKPLQKTVRRATPLFSHFTLFHPLINKRCKTIAKNSTSCNHTLFPCHPTPLLTPTPIAKPFQNHCKKHHFARIYLRSTSSATLSISLTSRHTFNISQRKPNTPQDGRSVPQDGAKTAQNVPRTAQDRPEVAQDRSTMAQDSSKEARHRPHRVQDRPQRAQDTPQRAQDRGVWESLAIQGSPGRGVWESLGGQGSPGRGVWESLGVQGSPGEYLGVQGSVRGSLGVPGSPGESGGRRESRQGGLGVSGSPGEFGYTIKSVINAVVSA